MGSVPFKSRQDKLIEQLKNKQRQIIYEKWKYEIQHCDTIHCSIKFDDMHEKDDSARFNPNLSSTNIPME